MREYAAGNAELSNGLVEIVRADPGFDPEHFLHGAKAAYEIIVTAFAEGNRRTLKGLLNSEVYDGFNSAIADRERRGEQIDQSFVGIKSADLVEADLKAEVAQLTVKFVSELISATRDRAGVVINGDPKRIREVTDIWTFARDAASRDPNWKLIATQAAN
jgi:predicted lipid-binding transport protein (Tim44 family)